MTPARVLEAAATGLWLGLVQLALGFALMAGAGAAAVLFLALTAAWLAGGVAGVLWRRPRATRLLLPAALAAATAARLLLAARPFSPLAICAALAAGGLCGAFAGNFLRDRAAAWGEVRRLLFHENNGFVLGYALGGVLLLVATRAVDLAALALGVSLIANEWYRGGVRRLLITLLLVVFPLTIIAGTTACIVRTHPSHHHKPSKVKYKKGHGHGHGHGHKKDHRD